MSAAVQTLTAPVVRWLTVSDAARILGIAPRHISDLFYRRKLDDSKYPIAGRHRLIREDLLGEIEAALREGGHLPSVTPEKQTA